MIAISLIGEQPIPNLLPLRYKPPDVAVLVYTDRTRSTSRRLGQLLRSYSIKVCPLLTDAYNIQQIHDDLKGLIVREKWGQKEIEFNLTGGTKTMVLAAYQVALEYHAPFVYLQSERKQSVLYRYRFQGRKACYVNKETLPGVITLDDYLRAYLDDYKTTGPKHPFEEVIGRALAKVVDEVLVGVTLAGALEVDLAVRKENQVGVVQAKTGNAARGKQGLDQLNAACEQRYLGTYTHKILVINQQWDDTQVNLRDLAAAWRIAVIELPSFTNASPQLSSQDEADLQSQVVQILTG